MPLLSCTCILSPGSVVSIMFITLSIVSFLLAPSFNSKLNFLFTKFKCDISTSSKSSTFWPITSAQCAQFNPPKVISTFLLFPLLEDFSIT